MSIFKKFFSKPPQAPRHDQLVRLHIPWAMSDQPLPEQYTQAADQYSGVLGALRSAAEISGLGELDGDEFGEGEYTIWLYGQDARQLAALVRSAAPTLGLPAGCSLFVRYGSVNDPNAKEEITPI